MTKTGQVREYFRQMNHSTPKACAKALGMPGKMIRRCVEELRQQGWLVHCDRVQGLYKFYQLEDDEHGRSGALQKKIWRAVRISRSFTVWDIAQLSGATIDYVKKYVAFLMRHGHVEKIGRDGSRAIYRRARDLPAAMPRMRSKRIKQELIRQDLLDLGWALMRAIRDDDMDQVHTAHAEIGKKIADSLRKKGRKGI